LDREGLGTFEFGKVNPIKRAESGTATKIKRSKRTGRSFDYGAYGPCV